MGAGAGDAGSASKEAAHPLCLVKIHADWCGMCTRLEPLWKRLGDECGASARLVLLDVTNQESTARAAREAESLGLGDFFDAHKSQTGTIALIDASTKQPLDVFKGELDFAKYQAALSKRKGECGT